MKVDILKTYISVQAFLTYDCSISIYLSIRKMIKWLKILSTA